MKIKLILIIAFVAGIGFSCEDSLDVKTRSQLLEESVLKDVTTAQALLNGALATLRNGNYYGRDFVIFPELLSDNCKLVNAGDRSGRGLNQSINLSGAHINIWFLYQTINRLNLILEAIDNGDISLNSQADAITVNRIKGQALFLRGLFYFDLVRTYSRNPNYLNDWDYGVPYVTEAVGSKPEIAYPSRPTVVATYEGIEADLLASVAAFTATGSPNTGSRNVPTRAAAQALLARVYLTWAGPLYLEKYALASSYATAAINSAFSALVATPALLNTQWTANQVNSESIFEVAVANQAENLAGDNSLQGWYTRQVNAAGQRVTGWGDVIASDELIAEHNQALDARFTLLTQRAVRDFEPIASRETRKYNATGSLQFGHDNIPVIRIAEMFLIRAEANLLGSVVDETAARADINAVRTRCGLTALDGATTGAALVTEYFAERRRELAFEGHRLFDFTRRGLDVLKPSGSVVEFEDFRVLANVPLAEVQANVNLRQNPGY
jgi:starch-binding outer membrane protein, SusD/RagB family